MKFSYALVLFDEMMRRVSETWYFGSLFKLCLCERSKYFYSRSMQYNRSDKLWCTITPKDVHVDAVLKK